MDAGGFIRGVSLTAPPTARDWRCWGREQELGSLFAFLQGVVELFV